MKHGRAGVVRRIAVGVASVAMHAAVVVGSVIGGVGATAQTLQAQVDPRGTYRTLHTPHFRVHFRPAVDSIARRAAVVAEDAYASLARELAAPGGRIDLLLADNLDLTNGFAQVFPTNRVVIYLQPPSFVQELRFSGDWLRLVITHELAHVFQLDRARGLWSVGRTVFGRNPILFPNSYTPSWVKEGLAVYYETALTGNGRDASTEFRTVAQAAANEGHIPPPGTWSLATSRFPRGQTAYAWGSMLMERGAAQAPDSGMRRFVDALATHPIPFQLGRASRIGFGASFNTLFERMRDSLLAAATRTDTTGDARWRVVSDRGFYAGPPRWSGSDTLYWTANNGREVAGLYRAALRADGAGHGAPTGLGDGPAVAASVRRMGRRNTLDANDPTARGIVFAQHDLQNPFVYRTDLYVQRGGRERRLTNGARLAQPDVRGDGLVVTAQVQPGFTRLVLVSPDGQRIVPLTRDSTSSWSDPRWSPQGDAVVAVEMLPSAEQRIVVLDTSGRVREIVTGARAVFGSPSFTPDGARLVWASDRSGRMQLETAPVRVRAGRAEGTVDTSAWRAPRADVRMASSVSTGVFHPSVSPDGRTVAALVYRFEGYQVAIASLDTTGPMAENRWYARTDSLARANARDFTSGAARRTMDTLQSRPYRPLGQLLPRYWMPEIGTGRTGDTYGLSSSGVDIANRHEWFASALFDRTLGEMDAYGTYRFAGAGVPLIDFSLSQEWDATFRTVDTAGVFLGDVARRRRFATLSSTWRVPRVRRSVSASVGAQFELRKFASDSDRALGPPGSITRRGTTYQSFFGSVSASTTQAAARALSAEEGFSITGSTAYRWRTDVPQQTESWRTVGIARGFVPIPLPGYARHVLAMRVAAGSADRRTASEFSIGGVSGVQTELFPGTVFGDPTRTFPVRGVASGVQRGSRALTGSVEYRLPLLMLTSQPGPFPVYGDRLSLNVYGDAGRAWCPAGTTLLFSSVCDRRKALDGWIATTGAELVMDIALQYDTPYRLRGGFGVPVASPPLVKRDVAWYLTFGSYF